MVVNHKKLNPNAFHLLRYMQDEAIRTIILYGGSSSGKSYSVAQVILLLTLHDGENSLVMRKVGASILNTIYQDYKQAARQLGISRYFSFHDGVKRIDCVNGAKIDFGGLDDPEKLKGISNYKRLQLEELSEYEEEDFKQVRKRLRGKRGQQIIGTFNPIKETHWIKKSVFDKEQWHEVSMDVVLAGKLIPAELTKVKSIRMNAPKSMLNPRTKEVETHAPDTVVIQSTYLNNFWVVGSPDGSYGFYDEQCVADFEKDRQNDPDYYQVYALGEWGVIRTGSEFFNAFNRGRHTSEVQYNPALPVHISVDSNVLPYISVTYWQAEIRSVGTWLSQIGETCAGNPDNTVRKSAKLVAKRLRDEWGYDGKVFLHGDASTKAANNIDDEKRSFHDLFISTLQSEGFEVVDMVSNKNPSVSMSGEFINAIWDGMLSGMGITISEECRTSIEDYMSVQKDANGAILKTKVKNKTTMQTYEEHGHISDTLRYIVVDLMREEFLKFSNRRKRNLYARDGAIHFFNPATPCDYSAKVVYCMPNVAGKFVMVYGGKCGGKWHIMDTAFAETASTEDIKQRLIALDCKTNVIECGDAYFPMVRGLRADSGLNIRVLREMSDVDRRIAATSDYVRSSILFHEGKTADSEEYAAFMQNMLDYNKDGQNKEASAALSGFIQFVEKNFAA